MRTGSTTTVALSRSEELSAAVERRPVLRFKHDPRSRVMRTFVFTFTTWAAFLCYLLVFAV